MWKQNDTMALHAQGTSAGSSAPQFLRHLDVAFPLAAEERMWQWHDSSSVPTHRSLTFQFYSHFIGRNYLPHLPVQLVGNVNDRWKKY